LENLHLMNICWNLCKAPIKIWPPGLQKLSAIRLVRTEKQSGLLSALEAAGLLLHTARFFTRILGIQRFQREKPRQHDDNRTMYINEGDAWVRNWRLWHQSWPTNSQLLAKQLQSRLLSKTRLRLRIPRNSASGYLPQCLRQQDLWYISRHFY
jgi:hypothetical protein